MIVITCWREASSGTTPPYCRCKGICEATTFETMCLPSRTIATEVSSHEVSIARMFIGQLYAHVQVSRQGTMDQGCVKVRMEAPVVGATLRGCPGRVRTPTGQPRRVAPTYRHFETALDDG